jgi:ABC-2 type transport system permease protein
VRVAAAVVWKDILLLLRDPQTTVILIMMPLVLAVIVGLAMEGALSGEGRLRVAAVDLDQSAASEAFLEDLDSREAIVLKPQRWERSTFTADDATALLDNGRRLAVLVVPEGFGESLQGGPGTELSLYTDPAQRQFVRSVAAVVEGELQRDTLVEAVAGIGEEAGIAREDALERLSAALANPLVSLREEGLVAGTSLPSGFDQTIPGFTVMFAMFMANFIVIGAFRERDEYGTWRRVLLSPAPRPVLLGGRLVSAYALGAVQMAALFLFGWLAFGMEIGNIGGLAVAVAIFLVIPVGVGLLFVAAKNYLLANSLLSLLVIVLGAIGGSLVPIFLLPGWMETLASFTPHYWALQALQDLMFRGASIAEVGLNLAVLAGFAAVLVAAGLARFSFAK